MSPSGYKQHFDEAYPIVLLLLTIFSFIFFIYSVVRERRVSKKSILRICYSVFLTYPEVIAIFLSIPSVAIIRVAVGHRIDLKGYVIISSLSILFWYYTMLLICRLPNKRARKTEDSENKE